MRKTRIWQAFLIKERKFSKNKNCLPELEGIELSPSRMQKPRACQSGLPTFARPRANDICEFTPARAATTIAQRRHTDSESDSDAGLFDWCKQLL